MFRFLNTAPGDRWLSRSKDEKSNMPSHKQVLAAVKRHPKHDASSTYNAVRRRWKLFWWSTISLAILTLCGVTTCLALLKDARINCGFSGGRPDSWSQQLLAHGEPIPAHPLSHATAYKQRSLEAEKQKEKTAWTNGGEQTRTGSTAACVEMPTQEPRTACKADLGSAWRCGLDRQAKCVIQQMRLAYTTGKQTNVCARGGHLPHLSSKNSPLGSERSGFNFSAAEGAVQNIDNKSGADITDDSPRARTAAETTMSFNNCCMTITDAATPDPFVTFAHGQYYMTFTAGDRVEIWSSPNLLELGRACERHTVWRPPPDTSYSSGIWAPELHDVEGRWYIYVAAEHPREGNKSHRMYVLGGPPSTFPPTSGKWEFLGPIAGMPDHWAIDGTILPLNGKTYFVYSGWPFANATLSDLTQELFIIELDSPISACSRAVRISQPTERWERSADHGINEGPQVLKSPDGQSWIGIVYSCAGSWTKDYKMNTLRYMPGSDPLSPQSWRKSRTPLVQGRRRGGAPFGPGHGSFLQVSGDTVAIFHATDGERDGWENRRARIQRVMWTADGPWMGEVGPLVNRADHYLAPGAPIGVGGFPGLGGGGGGLRQDVIREVEGLVGRARGWLKKI